MIVGEHLGRDHRVAEADHLHAHLLGQRLGQLIVGDQPHADGDLSEHFAGPLLLLLQQHLQPIFAEKAEVHQNLTDPPNRHDYSSVAPLRGPSASLLVFEQPAFGPGDPVGQVLRHVGLQQNVSFFHDALLSTSWNMWSSSNCMPCFCPVWMRR